MFHHFIQFAPHFQHYAAPCHHFALQGWDIVREHCHRALDFGRRGR